MISWYPINAPVKWIQLTVARIGDEETCSIQYMVSHAWMSFPPTS